MAVYHLSCGLVLYRKVEGEFWFLLLQYLGGHWGFVKGHVEKGEDMPETALRELTEETGIKHAFILPNFEEKIHYKYYHQGKRQNKDVIFLLGETDEEDIVISDEHQAYKWLPYAKCFDQLTFDNARRVLRAAGDYLGIS